MGNFQGKQLPFSLLHPMYVISFGSSMNQLFGVTVDLQLEELHSSGKQTGCHKSCFPLQNGSKTL